jgi:hypothetical protein
VRIDAVVSRSDLVDALSGRATGIAVQLAGVLPARASVAVRNGRSRTPWMMWLGHSHALVAWGDDPVALRHIRRGGAALAVLDAVGLRSGGDERPGSWWEVRIAAGDRTTRIEGFDRSPCATWLVHDDAGTTRIEPATSAHVARTIARAVARHAGVTATSSLV